MVAVSSTMQKLGSAAPDFALPVAGALTDVESLSDYQGQPLLIMFICNHCPFVIHLAKELTALANQATQDGFAAFAISSNDVVNYPQDAPDKMAQFANEYGFEFPYLYDESQEVAKRYGAACTPDFYVYDKEHRLVYRGQFDDSRPNNGIEITGQDLAAAIKAVLRGESPALEQRPSIGCNIKWRAGNAPDYF